MKFFVFKKKHIMLFLTILLVGVIVVVATLSFIKTTSPKKTYTVVIDAGHGGIDSGSVGVVTKNDENHMGVISFNIKGVHPHDNAETFFI